MRIAIIFLLTLCCAVGCGKTTAVDLEQQALRSALVDYFSAQHWQGKPCYLKRNDFTVAPEYPLVAGQPPAKVIGFADLKTLAKGGVFGPEWTIATCKRETKEGKDTIHVDLGTTQEKLDAESPLGVYGRGKGYAFEIKANSITLIDSGAWKE
jgi:hypothetical protein